MAEGVKSGWKFDPTVTLGHLVTTLTVVVAGLVWGLRLEGRVDAQAQISVLRDQIQTQRANELDGKISRNREDFTAALGEIRTGLRSISDKLDQKADKR